MSNTENAAPSDSLRRDDIRAALKSIIKNLTGIDDELDVHTTFLEMGADSLSLLQFSKEIEDRFGLKVNFRLLLEDLSTIAALAEHITKELLQAESFAPAAPAPAPALNSSTADSLATAKGGGAKAAALQPNGTLERLLTQQLQIMSQQLVLLGKGAANGGALNLPPGVAATPTPSGRAAEGAHADVQAANAALAAVAREHDTQAQSKKIDPRPYVAYQPHAGGAADNLGARQQQHLAALVALVNERTRGSKQRTQADRARMADSRAPAGFRLLWKELCYPLIIERGAGARAWDVDGNCYVDLTMGFGALLFGHSPPFLIEAMQAQLGRGLQLGWQSALAGKVAALISELTGVERVAFCNSGTEAVMSALRLARTVTGRTKIALFAGSYHGTFDGVLVRADASGHALPIAPGIPPHMIENVLVLDYGSPASLGVLREHIHELAAVLVEPSQSRRPDVQPRVFLHELRAMTRAAGAALIFDEVITGFRMHPGGAQAVFDVQADLVTYGKAVCAGIPIGVLAGTAQFMDTIDGGMWQYGDASYPQVETTFYAGTYFKHPLVMAAAWAALSHIKERGPELQEQLNQRTAGLVGTLNEYFAAEQLPIRVANFGSLFRFVYPAELGFMNLFYYYLLAKGVYICETRTCFLSTAHTEADLEQVIAAVKESVAEMRAGGFLPERPSAAAVPNDPAVRQQHLSSPAPGAGDETAPATPTAHLPAGARTAPITEAQKGLWVLAQIDPEAARAYNESINVRLQGRLNLTALRAAIQQVVNRHDALRTTFSRDGEHQIVAPALALEVPLNDLADVDERSRAARLGEWLAANVRQPFDLARGPLIRAGVARLGEQEHVLTIVVHHIVTDGWSFDVLRREVGALYVAECQGRPAQLPPPMQFSAYARRQAELSQSAETTAAETYWLTQLADPPASLALPADRPRPPLQTYNGAKSCARLDADLCRELKTYGARQGSTLFVVLLAAFELLLHKLTGQHDLVLGTHSAGQANVGGQHLIGFCINMLPLRSRFDGQQTFSDYINTVRQQVLDAHQHQSYPISRLIKKLRLTRDPSRPPLVSVVCNMDRIVATPELADVRVSLVESPVVFARFDLLWNFLESEGEVLVECIYNTDLFDARTVRGWADSYLRLLRLLVARPDGSLAALADAVGHAAEPALAADGGGLREAGHEKFKRARRRAVHAPS